MTNKNRMLGKHPLNRIKDEFENEIEQLVGKQEYAAFKAFAFQKSMTEVALAFMLGAAFQKLVGALSDSIIMPVITCALTATGTGWRDLVFTPIEGLNLEIGKFTGAGIEFMLMAVVLYVIYNKVIHPIVEDTDEITCIETMACPNCYEQVYYKANVCKFCTREINLFDGEIWEDKKKKLEKNEPMRP